jgi:hypothetical protein
MKKNVWVPVLLFVLVVGALFIEDTKAHKQPWNIYDQSIDNGDHLIVAVGPTDQEHRSRGYEATNIDTRVVTGRWKGDVVYFPVSRIPAKDRALLVPGNIVRVSNKTNYTVVQKEKYPVLRMIDTGTGGDIYLCDGDYRVKNIQLWGTNFHDITFTLIRLSDKEEFYGLSPEDFTVVHGTSIREGELVRLTGGAKNIASIEDKQPR